MTTPGDTPPSRGERVLPPSDPCIRRSSVLDEEEGAARPQDAGDLPQGGSGIPDAAHGPSRHGGVDALAVNRQLLAQGFDELHWEPGAEPTGLRHPEQREQRIDA